jgi:hypothetical protein
MPSAPYRGWTNPGYAFAKRQSQIAQGVAQQAQVRDQAGTIKVAMSNAVAGEGTAVIPFAFTCVAKPIFAYGAELAENQSASTGAFPTCSVVVHAWDLKIVGNGTYYLGATLGFVLTGTPLTQFYIHYSFRAMTLTNSSAPYNSTGNA